MLYGWIHVYKAISKMNMKGGKKRLKIVLIIILGILYLYQIGMLIAFFLSHINIQQRESNILYNSNIIAIAIAFFLLTLGNKKNKNKKIFDF